MQTQTVILSARVDPDTDRATRILAALRGITRQDIVKVALAKELQDAPELPTVQRLAAECPVQSEVKHAA